jgi:hypothetical protein
MSLPANLAPQITGQITHHAGGGTSITGRGGVDVFQLLVLANGLELEMKCPGMKLTRLGSALKFAKQRTG